MEKFTENLTKFKDFLETTNKIQTFSKISEYPEESKEFKKDLQKFGLGIFLWCKESYPHITNIYEKIDFLPKILIIKDIRKAVEEYYQFIEMVKKKELSLSKMEINETEEKFFKITINPIKILVTKSHLWRKINEETITYTDMFIKTIPILESYIKELSIAIKIETARYRVKSKRRTGKRRGKLTTDIIGNISKRFYKKCPPETVKSVEKLGDFGSKITDNLNYIKDHQKEDFYNLLELVKDLYEFNIDLVKFLLRLWHIYENSDRNYANNYKIDDEFPKMKSIFNHYLNEKLMKYCPILCRILGGFFFAFMKYRHIESHSTPDLKISNDGTVIILPKKGKKFPEKIRIDHLQTQIKTYISFIEALRIYR